MTSAEFKTFNVTGVIDRVNGKTEVRIWLMDEPYTGT